MNLGPLPHVNQLTRMVSVSSLLMFLSCATLVLPGSSAGANRVQGLIPDRYGSRAGPFNSIHGFSHIDEGPGCSGIGARLLISPNGYYSLEHVLGCTNESTMFCWAGVFTPRFPSDSDGIFDNPPGRVNWYVSVDSLHPTNSCALGLTEDGDLQFGIGPDQETDAGPQADELRIVSWSSNTSGLGVRLILQDNGILLLRADNSSILWQSMEGPILPASSSQINSVKSGYRYLAGILLSLILYSYPFP